MGLKAKTYNRLQINEFRDATEKQKDLKFLLENISAFRLLGWKLLLPIDLKFNTQGFGDVIKFTTTKTKAIYKGKTSDKKRTN